MESKDIKQWNRTSEFGVVIMKDWLYNPTTGQTVMAVSGPIKLVTAKEAFDFQPKGNETNWGIAVGTGEHGILILGCQVRAVYTGKSIPTVGVSCWNIGAQK